MLIGLLINPIAGMGGAVGLKGTDGLEILNKARTLGALPSSAKVAYRALSPMVNERYSFLTGPAELGGQVLSDLGLNHEVLDFMTTDRREDTINLCREFLLRSVSLILFCGGDGTARDVLEVTGDKVPILGIPAGVKMYSAVFVHNPDEIATIVASLNAGQAKLGRREIMDIDEDLFRNGILDAKLYGEALVPYLPGMVQESKGSFHHADQDEESREVAQYCAEQVHEEITYFIGPGSGAKMVLEYLGLQGTLLGFDVLRNGKLVAQDVNAEIMERMVEKDSNIKIILGVIGGQGFLIGRGNRQLTPKILRALGPSSIMVLAPPHKLKGLEALRVDTGDRETDVLFRGYIRVWHMYGRMKMVKVR